MHRHTTHTPNNKTQESCLLCPLLPPSILWNIYFKPVPPSSRLYLVPPPLLQQLESSIPLSFPFPLSQNACNTASDFTFFSLSSMEDSYFPLPVFQTSPQAPHINYLQVISFHCLFPPSTKVFAIFPVSSAYHLKQPLLLWLSCLREHGEKMVWAAGTEFQSQAN